MAKKNEIRFSQDSGFFQDLLLRFRLILRLMADRRVNFLLKLLPIAAAVYVVSPIDLIPGAVLPFIGALDDATVIWLCSTLFLSLCPEEVLQEHSDALHKVVSGTWRESPAPDAALQPPADEIVDVEAKDEL